MKKLLTALTTVCAALTLCPMAFADIPSVPRPETPSTSAALIIAVVVIVAAIVGIVLSRNKLRKK